MFEYPATNGIFPPSAGWEDNTCYLVEISMDIDLPIIPAIFYVGQLASGFYFNSWIKTSTGLFKHSDDKIWKQFFTDIYYIRYIAKIYSDDDYHGD